MALKKLRMICAGGDKTLAEWDTQTVSDRPDEGRPEAPRQEPPSSTSADEPWLPSAFQRRILDALKGVALTGEELMAKLNVGKNWLYDGGLRELKEKGLVRNSRRAGGYYRPDAPPLELAGFLGENQDS